MRRACLLAVAAAALLVAAPTAAAPGAAHIAKLFVAAPVRAKPGGGRLVATLAAIRPITSQQTAVPVIGTAKDAKGAEWLKVPLPGRPLGRTGWIPAANATLVPERWRLVVDRARRRATLFHDGKAVERVPVVVGKPSTPTPKGLFFVEEHVRQAAGSELGPWALATSAFSEVLQEFGGSPGQIALHGRSGPLLADPLGSAASHGCIRFDNAVMLQLAQKLTNGTPILIR
jgi:lipoprotein-anchoring transpeptidase ErfK/SrfK